MSIQAAATPRSLRSLPQDPAPRVGLTLGDPAGIGPEVAVQALLQTDLHRRADVQLFIAEELRPWVTAMCQRYGLLQGHPARAGVGLTLVDVPRLPELDDDLEQQVAPQPGHSTKLARTQAFRAVAAMADAARARQLHAMVTGPAPKGIFDHLAPRPPGQTEFIAERLGVERFAMMLAGPRLRVVPVTTHVPLRQVASLLSVQGIVDCSLAAAEALRDWLDLPSPRLAVCGLNPHAGEDGRVGDEEIRIIAPAVAQLRALGVLAEGPLVADTVFHRAMTGRFDAVICMYHDQALGPLKTVHFHDAVNLTCGLPVPRISPDHGTAYDIAGKGVADPTSMVHALTRAERMAQRVQAAELTRVAAAGSEQL
jgi:4-hydroxythreonine-4-phosphate dehydrogenase